MGELLILGVLFGAGLILGYRIGFDSGVSDGMKREFDDREE